MSDNTHNFKVGDTVRLNSGGPLMTVAKFVKMASGPDEIATTWFDTQGKEASGRYKPELLHVDNEQSSGKGIGARPSSAG
jgi:uncharacterized protein YodC (DUF2158 family)